jgi:hypothetical protein
MKINLMPKCPLLKCNVFQRKQTKVEDHAGTGQFDNAFIDWVRDQRNGGFFYHYRFWGLGILDFQKCFSFRQIENLL